MKPLILHDHELKHVLTLEKGQTFMFARPMEPQPVGETEYPVMNDYDHEIYRDCVRSDWGLHCSPFGPPGSEFFVIEGKDQLHGCFTGDCPHSKQSQCDNAPVGLPPFPQTDRRGV